MNANGDSWDMLLLFCFVKTALVWGFCVLLKWIQQIICGLSQKMFPDSLCSCCSTPHTCYETKLDLRLHAEQKRLHSKEGNGEKKFKIHCVSRSSRQSGTFRATWNDQTHKYCLLWDWWKTNSQLKSSLLLLSLLLLTPRCLCALSVIHRTA